MTGSNYLVEAGGKKILVDCGMFQGDLDAQKKNYEHFPYDASTIDALIVTHSHIDHIGRVPKLVKEGFMGTVFSTHPAKDLARIFLEDELKIMTKGMDGMEMPLLWDQDDLDKILSLWKGYDYHEIISFGEVTIEFFDAGHILGSAIVRIVADGKKIVFSGDLGNPPTPIINRTESPHLADYIVTESTYGDRIHEKRDERRLALERAIEDTHARRGVLLIPAFAMERTQELLYEINKLAEHDRIPEIAFYVDSPLAIKATEIYRHYEEYFNPETKDIIATGHDIFNFPKLKFTMTGEESKKILNVPPPKAIMAGSGMSTGGRILFHERNYLADPNTIMLFVGYQVRGTLGRKIKDGEKRLYIMGEEVTVNAEIRAIEGYSAHADQTQIMDWIDSMSDTHHRPQKVFITHGEPIASQTLAQKINETFKLETTIPKEGDSFEL